MPFRHNDENPLAKLVGLAARLGDEVPEAEQTWPLKVELRIYPYEIEDENVGAVRISFSEATLDLVLIGVEVIPKSRLGEAVVAPTLREIGKERTLARSRTDAADAKGSAGAKLNLAGGEAHTDTTVGASQSKTRSDSVKETENVIVTHLPVKAVGDNQWILSQEGGAELDGVFLNFDPLCAVSATQGSNRVAVELGVYVRSRHIKAELIEKPNGLFAGLRTRNQEALKSVLLARSLHCHVSEEPFRGAVCLARSEVTDEA